MALAIPHCSVALSVFHGYRDHHYRASQLSELNFFVFEGTQTLKNWTDIREPVIQTRSQQERHSGLEKWSVLCTELCAMLTKQITPSTQICYERHNVAQLEEELQLKTLCTHFCTTSRRICDGLIAATHRRRFYEQYIIFYCLNCTLLFNTLRVLYLQSVL